ncbi:MAG TPA: sigma-70 family RNA polymerase sigma factor [Povalibacter sp.]|nr:sigma-70 family RNA polymerase sigma factor [Povalibacter sp.]
MHEPDDKSLMLRFQADGDTAAFERLFSRNKDALLRFLLRLSGDPAIAEDISQHTWLRVIELAEAARYRADDAAAFRTFLFTLARNRYVDQQQRRHGATHTRSVEPMDETLAGRADDAILDPQLLTADSQTIDLLDQALRALPTEQREVIAMWMQGVELVDVARIVGAPWATIVSRKKYALSKVRAFLERAGIRQVSDVIA